MYSLLTIAVTAFVIALLLTPPWRNLAMRWGLLDSPDHGRKIHPQPIPRLGGVAIVAAFVGSFVVLLLFPLEGGAVLWGHLALAAKIFPAAAIVFATGLLDDLFALKPWQKLLGQTAAAITAFAAGLHFYGFSHYQFPSWGCFLATVIWLVVCTNAFNLIDGVDGLAAGVGFFATLTTLTTALLQKNLPLALATAPLAGALLGFLRYNFNPATIFLGDCGSLLIGFLLGCYSLQWTARSATPFGMTAPFMVLAVPLVDAALSIVRRFLRHRPIFGADRGHIHHMLLARGLTPRRAVLLLYAFCGFGACLSLLQSFFYERLGGAIVVLFCLCAWMGIRRLGYAEFGTARRILLGGSFRRLVNAQLELTAFRDALNSTATPDQCWEVLHRAYSDFGFNQIQMTLAGRRYRHTTNGHHIPNSWCIRIALSDTDYVNLYREFDTQAPPIIAQFADTVGAVLRPRVEAMLRPLAPDGQCVMPAADPKSCSPQPAVPATALLPRRSPASFEPRLAS